MQYYFYLDNVLMPIAPSAMEVKINNKNKTYDLAGGGEVNIINPPGLTQISFDLLIPTVKYPFSLYQGEFREAGYYLNHFEKLKCSGKPFNFIVIRTVTAELVLKFAAKMLPYTDATAHSITGNSLSRITSADARILLRNEQTGKNTYVSDTTMSVTLEEYTVKEDAEKYGTDYFVSLKLLQYNDKNAKTAYLLVG